MRSSEKCLLRSQIKVGEARFYIHIHATAHVFATSHPVLPSKQTMGFIHICIVLESYVDLEYKISVQFCSVGSPCLLLLGLRDYNVCQITCVTPSDKCNKRQASVSLVSLTKSEIQ